jgi:hypothetical protein
MKHDAKISLQSGGLSGDLTACMIDKIATRGITYEHLQQLYSTGGVRGLRDFFLHVPHGEGKPVVTSNANVTQKAAEHFQR